MSTDGKQRSDPDPQYLHHHTRRRRYLDHGNTGPERRDGPHHHDYQPWRDHLTRPYAGPPVTVTHSCGFERTCRTPGIADSVLKRHSCESWKEKRRRAEWREKFETSAGKTKDCRCKNVKHEHGTFQAYKMDACRCRPCRSANNKRAGDRARKLAYGTWDSGRTDAAPIREHILMLKANGISSRGVANATAISRSSIENIANGKNQTVLKTAAEKILGVHPGIHALSDGCLVDSTGTIRRIQALFAIGWPQGRIADQIGVTSRNLAAVLKSTAVTLRTAKRVSEVYDRLWDKPPVANSGHDLGNIKRARNIAAVRGWLPPMAWDDETIDDPDGCPELGVKKRLKDTIGEDIEFLANCGSGRDEIAERLGYSSWASVERQLHRIGRKDLIALTADDTRTNASQARIGRAA